MNTKTNKAARNKGNPYFLRVPWNKGGLVNTGPGHTVPCGSHIDLHLKFGPWPVPVNRSCILVVYL